MSARFGRVFYVPSKGLWLAQAVVPGNLMHEVFTCEREAREWVLLMSASADA